MDALLCPPALMQQASVSRPKFPAISFDLFKDLIQDQGTRDLATRMADEFS
jgi:hypothetical protein